MAPTASEYPLNAPPHALLGGTDSRKRADSGVYCAFCKADLKNYSIITKENIKRARSIYVDEYENKKGDIIIFFGV